jgi:hypothetical protein
MTIDRTLYLVFHSAVNAEVTAVTELAAKADLEIIAKIVI